MSTPFFRLKILSGRAVKWVEGKLSTRGVLWLGNSRDGGLGSVWRRKGD